jgi:hypothetical protein
MNPWGAMKHTPILLLLLRIAGNLGDGNLGDETWGQTGRFPYRDFGHSDRRNVISYNFPIEENVPFVPDPNGHRSFTEEAAEPLSF